MNSRHFAVSIATVLSCLALQPTVSWAQSVSQAGPTANSGAAAQTPSQRKADRASLRAKKNAELSKLEKSGNTPGGDAIHYPQSFQDAQRKANLPN
jgi:hypothetical protein